MAKILCLDINSRCLKIEISKTRTKTFIEASSYIPQSILCIKCEKEEQVNLSSIFTPRLSLSKGLVKEVGIAIGKELFL